MEIKELPNIQEMENFIIYGKVRNFTLAADQAHITQSAFSFQMKKLEERLGVKLILRSNRGSCLTPEGEFFYKKINKIMPELMEAIYELQEMSSERPLELKVGVLTSLGDILMSQHVTYFRKNGNIRLTVYSMEKDDLIRSLNNGKIDIASTFLADDEKLENFDNTLFRMDRMVYYAPNIPKLKEPVSISDVFKLPLAKYPPNNFMNKMIDQYFNTEGKLPVVAAQLSSPYAIIQFCKENCAGALVVERLLNTLDANHGHGYFALSPSYMLKAYLLYKKKNPKYRAIKLFIDYVVNLNRDNK
ncbi:DNA-binding transcriptional LysR family regulator [Sporomusaceae bacterium BoRhaA]|uniref:LysR family transcriptional regulator n=1 Tax=Pelorhabdus rhamnosifermentans TaxID=2772457 RepID=UPI001FE2454A|nr:LysR family transcriptional regulator [Pelorhabdus rhamnosifermentans]MBU2701737.1 DNA-binding transcriptional LysR family regulator [Pelorhabdus rhamnosifermentans]